MVDICVVVVRCGGNSIFALHFLEKSAASSARRVEDLADKIWSDQILSAFKDSLKKELRKGEE